RLRDVPAPDADPNRPVVRGGLELRPDVVWGRDAPAVPPDVRQGRACVHATPARRAAQVPDLVPVPAGAVADVIDAARVRAADQVPRDADVPGPRLRVHEPHGLDVRAEPGAPGRRVVRVAHSGTEGPRDILGRQEEAPAALHVAPDEPALRVRELR